MKQNGRRIQLDNYMEKNPPNSKRVIRSSRWGNPYPLPEYTVEESLRLYEVWLQEQLRLNKDFLDPLLGKDLICTCKLENPCHTDVLLKYVQERELTIKKFW